MRTLATFFLLTRVWAATSLCVLMGGTVHAEDAASQPAPQQPWREVTVGVDAMNGLWLAYTGTTMSPYGGLYENGLRLRVTSGYGQYSYKKRDSEGNSQDFEAETTFTEALAGYLHQFGPLTVKVFAGIVVIGHGILPIDPDNSVQGFEYGPKGTVELWLNVGENGYASLDLGATSAHWTSSGRARVGYRVSPTLSAGFEGIVNINAEDLEPRGDLEVPSNEQLVFDNKRAGIFVRYEWDWGELSASGGLSSEISGGEAPSDAFGTLNWIARY